MPESYHGQFSDTEGLAGHVSESLVLRSYPFGEADLVVSFLARDTGKQRGVAKRARRVKHGFGAALERLSQVRMQYVKRETRELVTIQEAEIIRSPFDLSSSYDLSLVLDYMAEVTEYLLPAEETNERYFRLLLAMIDHLRQDRDRSVWPVMTYFSLWSLRLAGLLGNLRVRSESAAIVEEMLLLPIAKLPEREWTKQTGQDLRRYLIREIESHIERKLLTPPMVEAL
jgi:DNA repair protein RecO (recombination protein O)